MIWILTLALVAASVAIATDDSLRRSVRVALMFILVLAAQGTYSAFEAHKHTHEILEVLEGRPLFNDNGERI